MTGFEADRLNHHPFSPEEERGLVAAATHDDRAFGRLYDAYLPRVYAYVGYRLPAEDVEDVVAETFVKMARGLRRFHWRGPGSFSAWLFRIAHNEIAGYYRRRGPEAVALDVANDVGDDVGGDDPPLDGLAEASERAALIRRLVASLPPRRQEVILLRFFGGLSNREIAAILDLDERTVASNLSRALDDLRRRWPMDALTSEGGKVP